MKTYLLLTALIALSISSCKKQYICQCVNTNTYVNTATFSVKAKNLSDAEVDCVTHNNAAQSCYIAN